MNRIRKNYAPQVSIALDLGQAQLSRTCHPDRSAHLFSATRVFFESRGRVVEGPAVCAPRKHFCLLRTTRRAVPTGLRNTLASYPGLRFPPQFAHRSANWGPGYATSWAILPPRLRRSFLCSRRLMQVPWADAVPAFQINRNPNAVYCSSVDRSPISAPVSCAFNNRRMIFPERVLGSAGTNLMAEGVAMGPISRRT